MIACNYFSGRLVPAYYSRNQLLSELNFSYFHLCLVNEGFAVVLIDGERCYLGKNMILCLEPDRHMEVLATQGLQVYSLSFSPSFINKNLSWEMIRSPEYISLCKDFGYPEFVLFRNRNILFNGLLPTHEGDAEKIKQVFLQAIEQLENQPDKRWSCRARSIIFQLMDILELLQQRFMEEATLKDELVLEALSFIHRNSNHSLTIEGLCHQLHVNRNSLNSRFKKATGYSIIDYVIEHRIHLAKQALAFTTLSIDEIAASNGFHEQTYFTKLFKKRKGITPSQYRKMMRDKRM